MKARFCLAALAVATLVAVTSLRAADEKPALKCPVSAQAAKTEHSVDFNGGKVAFCCPNCPKAFNANSAKFASKANLQLVQSGQLTQVACPFSGKPVAAGKTVAVGGVEIGFCCGNCQGKAGKATGDEQLDLIFKDTTKGFKAAAAK